MILVFVVQEDVAHTDAPRATEGVPLYIPKFSPNTVKVVVVVSGAFTVTMTETRGASNENEPVFVAIEFTTVTAAVVETRRPAGTLHNADVDDIHEID